MAASILVTGATGNVGAEIVKILRDRGIPVAAAVRNPAKAREQLGDGVDYVPFDFDQPATFAAAMHGIKSLFIIRPPAVSDAAVINAVIGVAKAAGVAHIVFLSIQGGEKNRFVPHYKIEQAIMRSGLTWTLLRAGFFMQNLNTTHRAEIKERNEIFVPAGKGRTSFIDVRDIAAVGAKALSEPGHENKAYTLTGNVALNYHEVASTFSSVLGRPIVYREPSLLGFARGKRAEGTAWPFIAILCALYTTARFGLAAGISDDLVRVLGRQPIPLRQYVQDYRAAWE